MLGAAPPPAPPPAPPLQLLELLARGADVQLTLEDVVDDRLAQVVDHVAVAVLEGQSEQQRAEMSSALQRGGAGLADWRTTHLLLVELTKDMG